MSWFTRARSILLLALFLDLPSLVHGPAAAAQSCGDDPSYAALDFWIGEWDVLVQGRLVGTNRIEKRLGDCAILEWWTSSDGGEGMSLFYFEPGESVWKQVWVTPSAASRPGGIKEKTQVEAPAGSVRFRGRIPWPSGGSYLDRTTLTPLHEGRVRQHIEISRDEGTTWQTAFDAVYVPVER